MHLNPFAEIHWAEGMLLQPHHLQLWQRQIQGSIHGSIESLQPFAWGVRKLEIDRPALENFIISIPTCDVRLPDGTELQVPENGDLPQLDIKKAMTESQGKPLDIRIGIPLLRPRAANVGEGDDGGGMPRRYHVNPVEVSDENSGGNLRPVDVRRLNAHLFLPGDEAAEYCSTVPVLRIVRAGEGEFLPAPDEEFIPPALELDGSPRLREMAREVLNRASAKSSALAGTIAGQHISFTLDAGGNPELLLKLHVLNGFLPYYQQLLLVPRLHPVAVYCELCRLAGELAIFTEERLYPKIPPYDHGDLGTCFGKLFEIVDDLLKRMYVARAPRRRFEPWKDRFLVVTLDSEFFDQRNTFYVAIDTDLDRKDVAHFMERGLISIGSKATIADLARQIRPGIRRRLEEKPPLALPENPRRTYFRLFRTGGDEELSVGTEELAIFNGSGRRNDEMEFSLFVVSGDEKAGFEIE